MASDKKKVMSKKHIEPSDAIKNYLMEQPSKKKPEYLVRGALLHCRCGSYARRLNLPKDHAIYMTDHPVIHELNCICGEGENITPFGVCKSARPPETEIITCAKDVPRGSDGEPTGPTPSGVDIGRKCSPVIVGMKWQNSYGKSRIVDNGEQNPSDRAAFSSGKNTPKGEATVTTVSFLVCQYGGLIEPYTSGQEYKDTNLLKEEFLKNMQEQFGFDSETAQIMWDVYTQLQAKYPNATQGEIDWRFARLLGGFQYDEDYVDRLMWDSTAGKANDQFRIETTHDGSTIFVPLTEQEYFVDFLGIPKDDYLILRYKVRIQHEIAGDTKGEVYELPEDYDSLNQAQLNKLAKWKGAFENKTGRHISSNEEFLTYWTQQYDQFCRKPDFAHQQVTSSAILVTPLNKNGLATDIFFLWNDEKREDMAGWLGDATLDEGNGISFGPDDYMSDLDAENITSLISKEGLSYIEAMNLYYEEINSGKSRADIFLENTGLSTVKEKVYSELLYPNIRLQMNWAAQAGDIKQLEYLSDLMKDDKRLLDMVKTQSEGTYNFIKSLENGEPEMRKYQ